MAWRERGARRDARALDALKFCHGPLWRALFGRQAKDLEQSNTVIYFERREGGGGKHVFSFLFIASFSITPPPPPPLQAEDEYMISDADLYVTRYASRGGSSVNVAAFVAGIVRGALSGAGFPARVTAHWVAPKGGGGGRPRPQF